MFKSSNKLHVFSMVLYVLGLLMGQCWGFISHYLCLIWVKSFEIENIHHNPQQTII